MPRPIVPGARPLLVTAAALGMALAAAPAAGAQTLPTGSAGGIGIESAPLPVALGGGTVTLPVPGPARPEAEYGSAEVFPSAGAVVGVAQPVMITFDRPVTDRARAEATIGVRSNPEVAGKFYWISDTEVRWRPLEFWPANTAVTVHVAGRDVAFRTGDAVVTTYDDPTHTATVTRNGTVERVMRASAGGRGWETYNGTYYTGQRGHDVRMNSAEFGLRKEDGGYDSIVHDAIRLSYDGIYIHAAPWSVADQGVRDVSNGCINLSPEDAAWFYGATGDGDPVIVQNGPGKPFGLFDGQGDWNN